MTIFDFQNDLKNGMSITDALQKHDLTLEQAFQRLHHSLAGRPVVKKKPKKSSKTGEKYISSRQNTFYIRKIVYGKYTTFGTYSSLEDAIKVRDYCIAHGWKQDHIDEYCQRLGVIRCWDKRKKERVRYS